MTAPPARPAAMPESTVPQSEPAAIPAPQRRRARVWSVIRPVWADVALVAVIVGAHVRLQRWNEGVPLWLDEQMISLNIRDRDFTELAGPLEFNQAAPLGWLWLERLAVRIAGADEQVLRFAPLAFGIGTIVVAWWIGRRWLGPVGAVVLTLLCAFTPQFLRYSDEVKQYTSDTFWVLTLVGLAAWVLDDPRRTRRPYVWWAVAAFALWFSMAAVLVAPGLVLVLVGAWWRRHGWRAALAVALPGFGWLVSLGAHYLLALRHALGSDFLTAYWAAGFPPTPSSVDSTVSWLADQPALLAADPIGTPDPGLFWTLMIFGLVVALLHRPLHGLVLLVPVVSAAVLAVIHVVPLIARLALWLIPVLFVLVAVAVDAPARALAAAPSRARVRQRVTWWVAVTAFGCAAVMAVDAAVLLIEPLTVAAQEPRTRPNGGDDRAAVRWVAGERRDGDLVLVTRHAYTAFRWYDRSPDRPGTFRLTETTRPGDDCSDSDLIDAVKGHRRVIFYSGVRLTPYPRTHEVIAAHLARQATLVQIARWGAIEVRIYEIWQARPPDPPVPGLATIPSNCVKVFEPDR